MKKSNFIFAIVILLFASCSSSEELKESELLECLLQKEPVLLGVQIGDDKSKIIENNKEYFDVIEGSESITLWKEWGEKGINQINIIFDIADEKVSYIYFEFLSRTIESHALIENVYAEMKKNYDKYEKNEAGNWINNNSMMSLEFDKANADTHTLTSSIIPKE